MRESVRILVADDHPVFRMGLALALRQLGFGHVSEHDDGTEVVRVCRVETFDVLILDVKMERLSGFDAIRALRADWSGQRPFPKTVIMSAFDQPAVIRAGAALGVDAFVGKETEPARLATLIDGLVANAQGATRSAHVEHSIEGLSQREREVLHYLCNGSSAKAIGSALGISSETVRDHLGRLYGKLQVRDRAAAVHMAHQLGWVTLEHLEASSTGDGDS